MDVAMRSTVRGMIVMMGLGAGCSFDASGSAVNPNSPPDASITADATVRSPDAGAPDARSGEGHGGGDDGPGKH